MNSNTARATDNPWFFFKDLSLGGYNADCAGCCYDQKDQRLFITWNEGSFLSTIYYDVIFNKWSEKTTQFDVGGLSTVLCCYDAKNQKIYSSWQTKDSVNKVGVAFCPANISTDPTMTQITTFPSSCLSNVACCTNSSGTLYITWVDSSYHVKAAFYHNGTWSSIPTSQLNSYTVFYGDSIYRSVNCCYDSIHHRLYLCWPDQNQVLRIAYFNGSSWHLLTLPADYIVNYDIHCCYDAASNRLYLTWSNLTTFIQAGFFDATQNVWKYIYPRDTELPDLYVNRDVSCSYDPLKKRLYATWANGAQDGGRFLSAYYDVVKKTWIDISPEPSDAHLAYYVNCCYDPESSMLYTVFNQNTDSLRPARYYSGPNPPPPNPPHDDFRLQGVQKKNDFGVVSEWFNVLSWSQFRETARYVLKRNNTTIATLPASQTMYEDHNRVHNKADRYVIFAFDASGAIIATDELTIQGK